MDGKLSLEKVNRYRDNLKRDDNFEVLSNSVHRNGISEVMFNTQNSYKIQDIFNTEIEDMSSITNQKQSGRCWMFAGLNVIRMIIKKNLKIKDIELSESYLMFYDKLEKCNTTLDYVIKNVNENVDSRLFRYILNMSGDNDGGFWHYFVKLIKKYGVCPKDVMGESYDSSHSDTMNSLISTILTKHISEIRKNSNDLNKMLEIKDNALNDVYKILATCIGIPVDTFTFDFEEVEEDKKEDKDKKDENDKENKEECKDENDYECKKDDKDEKSKEEDKKKRNVVSITMTPKEFAEKYINTDLDDYILLINYPSERYKFNQTYSNLMNKNILDDEEIQFKALNVDINIMKKAVIDSIMDNSPVWFACDVTVDSNRYDGFLSTEVINPSKTLNIDFKYDKVDRIELLNTECNHAMTFVGVHLEDNDITKPIRWKVQNSWGEDKCKKGMFLMTDTWFTDYVYECVINKKYLSDQILEDYKKDPILLEPWNVIV